MTPFLLIIEKMKKKKLIVLIITGVVSALGLAVLIPFSILGTRTAALEVDYTYLLEDTSYNDKLEITGINLKKQDVSCGYATIEMMSEYYGDKVDEIELSRRNDGAITTQSSDGFLKEANVTIASKDFVKRSYLKNDDLLKEIHDSIKNNNPVAIEWAAKLEDEWTLHFSLITGVDYANDNITIYNPYGYIENIKTKEFIDRASFKAYEHLPLFLAFGFAFGAFEKNTIFYAK